jgi:hypothetical protein
MNVADQWEASAVDSQITAVLKIEYTVLDSIFTVTEELFAAGTEQLR